jgi:CRP/FNR family transcriptional regulator, cyclic AMP receptor protein
VSSFKKIPFLRELEASQAEAFERDCVCKRFEQKGLILDFDDASTDVYFIVSGAVRALIRTPAGREMILEDLESGAFFGEMAAIDGLSRSANVTALTSAELLIMPSKTFKTIIFSCPPICEALLTLLTRRVRSLNERLFERSVLDLRHRLYAELLRLARPRSGAPRQFIISPPPLGQDLAALVGCRREQISRELQALVEEGLVERRKGSLVLLQPQLLQRRVSEGFGEAG